jgi:hypothetical protein
MVATMVATLDDAQIRLIRLSCNQRRLDLRLGLQPEVESAMFAQNSTSWPIRAMNEVSHVL